MLPSVGAAAGPKPLDPGPSGAPPSDEARWRQAGCQPGDGMAIMTPGYWTTTQSKPGKPQSSSGLVEAVLKRLSSWHDSERLKRGRAHFIYTSKFPVCGGQLQQTLWFALVMVREINL